jgi:hypothetical protein
MKGYMRKKTRNKWVGNGWHGMVGWDSGIRKGYTRILSGGLGLWNPIGVYEQIIRMDRAGMGWWVEWDEG